jgi:hypothetical protein
VPVVRPFFSGGDLQFAVRLVQCGLGSRNLGVEIRLELGIRRRREQQQQQQKAKKKINQTIK